MTGTVRLKADTTGIRKMRTVRSVRLSGSAPSASAGATARPSRSAQREGWQPDRVIVIALWTRTPHPGGLVFTGDVLRFTLNGKSWPNTERLAYTEGDSVRFRIINTSGAVHPMHLHGFYFNVESRGDGTRRHRCRHGRLPRAGRLARAVLGA